MGRDLVKQNDETASALFDAASAAAGVDIQKIALRGPDRMLAKTAHLQPALTVVELALFQKLTQAGYTPSAVAGHSVGELSALSACGMANALDAVRLAALRGRLMAEAATRTPGAMAALAGADFETVRAALNTDPPDGVLDIAAVNGPSQVVLSGDIDTVEQTTKQLSERLGVKGTRLRVSGAWHSPHMADAVLPLENALKKMALTPAGCPMIFNRDGLVLKETTAVPGLLAEQLIRPVRFDKVMARFVDLSHK